MQRAFRFPLTIFLSAFLLFQIQPMIGRFVLPWFGGGPAVWTTCMLFFQVLLLGGYAYAHWIGSRPNTKFQAIFHVALLAASLLFLPIAPRADVWRVASTTDPSGRILLLLAATIGGPYLVLSATGPLLQRWLSLTHPGESPWRLYSLSNLGSFLALLSYPFAIEPFLRLHTQVTIWSVLYGVFAIFCGWTAWQVRSVAIVPVANVSAGEGARKPSAWDILFWLGLSACSSVLLLATTNQVSQEIAVVPFLWVAPLSIYLLTFILTFESTRWYRRTFYASATGVLAPVTCALIIVSIGVSLWWQLAIYLVTLFVTCMLSHGELAQSRPSPHYLTAFYLTIAAGGALGGVFVALIAPRIFIEFSEFPIGLAAACLLGFAGWLRTGALKQWTSGNFAIRIPLMALLIGGLTSVVASTTNSFQQVIESRRNFYGILRITEDQDQNGAFRQLTHGRIRHGIQYLDPQKRDWPTTYYGPHSGVATVLDSLKLPGRRVAVVGLGTGTIAAWGRQGDTFRFYEINPAVEQIANSQFTFLKDSKARTEVVLGDARVQLEHELSSGPAQVFDVIAVDAFSSDAIPLHLLTAECGDIYRRHLAEGGQLLLHISNRSLNLEPVARGLARHLGWGAALLVSRDDKSTGENTARWVVITANEPFLEHLRFSDKVSEWSSRPPLVWTDDFASLWHVLRIGSADDRSEPNDPDLRLP